METEQVFVVQFALSLVAWGVVARWTFAPQLARMAPATALSCLALPHAFRHVGMVFVVPGVVAHQLPEGFAVPAAYGDLATGVLALVAVVLLRAKWTGAIGLVWLFNVVGALDLANALRHVDVVSGFGSAWYIPTMLVPLLLVTHFMMFVRLVKGAGEGGWHGEPDEAGVGGSSTPTTIGRNSHTWRTAMSRSGTQLFFGFRLPFGDQSHTALIGEIRPGPLGHDDEAVAEADEIPNVNEQPGQPGTGP